jgi:hypothetical protein
MGSKKNGRERGGGAGDGRRVLTACVSVSVGVRSGRGGVGSKIQVTPPRDEGDGVGGTVSKEGMNGGAVQRSASVW